MDLRWVVWKEKKMMLPARLFEQDELYFHSSLNQAKYLTERTLFHSFNFSWCYLAWYSANSIK